MRRERTAMALVAVLICGALAGCGVFSQPVPQDNACSWLSDGTGKIDGAPRRVFLLDRSNSTRGGGEGGAPDYVRGLEPLLRNAVQVGAVVSVGTFDGTAASVEWVAQDLATDRGRTNPENRKDDADAAQSCLRDRLGEAGNAAPRQPGSDVLGAMKLAAERLGDSGDRAVVMATDGLPTTGCADLTAAPIGSPDLIDRIVGLCTLRDELSRKVEGVGLTLIGVGHPAADQPQPATPQLFWLKNLWSTLCTSMRASACTVSVDSVVAATGTRAAEPTVDDPVVAFPPPESGVAGPGGSVTFPVDPKVLFDRNSERIRPEGAEMLVRIAARIRDLGDVTVTVNGYSEAQSTPADNLGLATRRAQAVSATLVAEGVPSVPQGSAGTAPNCPVPAPGKGLSELDRQCNRRVDIVVRPARS